MIKLNVFGKSVLKFNFWSAAMCFLKAMVWYVESYWLKTIVENLTDWKVLNIESY